MAREESASERHAERGDVRSFVAVEPSARLRDALIEGAGALRRDSRLDARWVPASNLHLTLCFLGGVESARLAELGEALVPAVASLDGFELAVRGIASFPSSRRPRVVAAVLDPDPRIERLAAVVTRTASEVLGFEVGDGAGRRFRAHITLARIRRPPSAETRARLAALSPGELPPLEVTAVSLFASELTPGGARYTRLASAPLGGDAGG